MSAPRMAPSTRYFAPVLATVALAIAPGAATQDRAPVRTVKGGVLDQITLFSEKAPTTARVRIRPFSATDDDITKGEKKDETKTMQSEGPGLLAEGFVTKLKELGPFTDVSPLGTGADVAGDALLVEGKFTELDPGSRAKRYFAGFGAGKSAVSVEGTVKGSGGVVLASFEQRRIGVMGVAGGNSLDKLKSDTKDIGEDIAKFVSAWAKGKNLK